MVGIGLNNIIAVAMTDAVLVADISHAQDVQKALDALKAKNATQASAFLKDHRPWGLVRALGDWGLLSGQAHSRKAQSRVVTSIPPSTCRALDHYQRHGRSQR